MSDASDHFHDAEKLARKHRATECRHAAARALRYGERELYDELIARAEAIERGES